MAEQHSRNGGPACKLEVPARYLKRRHEIAYRRGWGRGLSPDAKPSENSYIMTGMHKAWRAGFDDVRKQMAEAAK